MLGEFVALGVQLIVAAGCLAIAPRFRERYMPLPVSFWLVYWLIVAELTLSIPVLFAEGDYIGAAGNTMVVLAVLNWLRHIRKRRRAALWGGLKALMRRAQMVSRQRRAARGLRRPVPQGA